MLLIADEDGARRMSALADSISSQEALILMGFTLFVCAEDVIIADKKELISDLMSDTLFFFFCIFYELDAINFSFATRNPLEVGLINLKFLSYN